MSKSDLEALPEIIVTNQNQLQIDILLTQNTLFKKMAQHYVTPRQFGDRTVRCITVEGLVILKFYALPSLYRQGQFDRASIYENDILLLLLSHLVNLDSTFQVLSNHLLPSDLREIRAIASEIDAKSKRFSTQQRKLQEES